MVSNSSKGSRMILVAPSGKGQAEGLSSLVPRTTVGAGVGAGASAAKAEEMKRIAMHTREMIVCFISLLFDSALYRGSFDCICWKREGDVGRVRYCRGSSLEERDTTANCAAVMTYCELLMVAEVDSMCSCNHNFLLVGKNSRIIETIREEDAALHCSI